MDTSKVKDKLMKIVYEVIRDWLQNKLPAPDQTAFDLTPKSSALFYELMRRIKTMHDERGLELQSMVSHITFKPMVNIVWGGREGTFQPHQAMTFASQLIEATQAAITDAFLFTFLVEHLGMPQEKAWLMLQDFREYRDGNLELRTPQPSEELKAGEDQEREDGGVSDDN